MAKEECVDDERDAYHADERRQIICVRPAHRYCFITFRSPA
jgi:hypothetical protein